MPIANHAMLRLFANMVGFMSGGLAGGSVYSLLIHVLVDGFGVDPGVPPVLVPQMIFAAVVIFGGAILGLKMGESLVVLYIPAHCRACGGSSDPYDDKEVGRQTAYKCRTCGLVNLAPLYRTR